MQIFITLFLFISTSFLATTNMAFGDEGEGRVNPVIRCLAKEEQMIHSQKLLGPVYQINAELLNELLVDEELMIKRKYAASICSFKEFSPSVQVLRYLMSEGRGIFDIGANDVRDGRKESVIANLIDIAPQLLISYLMWLQGTMPTTSCLEKNVPEIARYVKLYRYYQDEDSADSLIFNKQSIYNIFNGLKNFDKLMKICQQQKENALRPKNKMNKATKEVKGDVRDMRDVVRDEKSGG
ncbi:MAG: hypothetical protein HQK53_06400 [Oligoflexia bacterium]|nr:hypothetical protein [Oligoflexia bacterium]